MNLNYAIFRSQPIMTMSDLRQIGSHNNREKQAYNSNPDIKLELSKDNIELIPINTTYTKRFKENDILIEEEIKYYIIMRLLCVFNIKKMDKIDFYYSLYLIVYFYKNINGNFYESINKIIEDMECVK